METERAFAAGRIGVEDGSKCKAMEHSDDLPLNEIVLAGVPTGPAKGEALCSAEGESTLQTIIPVDQVERMKLTNGEGENDPDNQDGDGDHEDDPEDGDHEDDPEDGEHPVVDDPNIIGEERTKVDNLEMTTAMEVPLGQRTRRISSTAGLNKAPPNDSRTQYVAGWLYQNYEACDDVSMPRSAVYEHYLAHCGGQKMEAINSASFGKIIRTIFPTLRTRRLGTRGNSKYHYYGIRPRLQDGHICHGAGAAATTTIIMAPIGGGKRHKGKHGLCSSIPVSGSVTTSASSSSAAAAATIIATTSSSNNSNATQSYHHESMEHHALLERSLCRMRRRRGREGEEMGIGGGASSGGMGVSQTAAAPPPLRLQETRFQPLVPNYEEFARFVEQICQPLLMTVPKTVPFEQIVAFSALYQKHVVHLLQLICTRDFALVEVALNMFWRSIPRDLLPALHCEEGIRIVSLADDYLYQVAIHILVPDVLDPLPLPIAQAIRHFARSLEVWLAHVFDAQLPVSLIESKLEIARRFCQVLRRRTSLNHLAQAVRALLSSPEHLMLMTQDWALIDFVGIREQAQWIVRAKEHLMLFVEATFKSYLFEGAPLPQWMSWLEGLVEQCLAGEMAAGEALDSAARNVLLRWSFLTSLVMRDLTLRSASAFGSFHLFRLLFDEYLLYYLEKKLDEHRRAIGLLSFLPVPPDPVTNQLDATTMSTGFASMDDLFRRSGLLAYCSGGQQPSSSMQQEMSAGTGVGVGASVSTGVSAASHSPSPHSIQNQISTTGASEGGPFSLAPLLNSDATTTTASTGRDGI